MKYTALLVLLAVAARCGGQEKDRSRAQAALALAVAIQKAEVEAKRLPLKKKAAPAALKQRSRPVSPVRSQPIYLAPSLSTARPATALYFRGGSC